MWSAPILPSDSDLYAVIPRAGLKEVADTHSKGRTAYYSGPKVELSIRQPCPAQHTHLAHTSGKHIWEQCTANMSGGCWSKSDLCRPCMASKIFVVWDRHITRRYCQRGYYRDNSVTPLPAARGTSSQQQINGRLVFLLLYFPKTRLLKPLCYNKGVLTIEVIMY